MINNRYLPNDELVQKLVLKVVELESKDWISKRDIERYNAIIDEIITRMNKEQKSNNESDIMTPQNEMWDDFCQLLTITLVFNPCDSKTLIQSKNILKEYYPSINIDKTLKYFEFCGGYCDCEVLMNVDME